MSTTMQRRIKILRYLCRCRFTTAQILADMFQVSERTIRRDIAAISMTEPIYSKEGRGGGVYVTENYYMDRMYIDESGIAVLEKLDRILQKANLLEEEELQTLHRIISMYKKPEIQGS